MIRKLPDSKFTFRAINLKCISKMLIAMSVTIMANSSFANPIYNSTPIQTVLVDSRQNVLPAGQSKVFTIPLDAGISYKFVANGIWTPDYRYLPYTLAQLQADPALLNQYDWLVDAKYVTQDSWNILSDFDPKGYGDFGLYSSLLGSGNDDFWGSYSASHGYEFETLGIGQAADFYIYDINYDDNFGSYSVNLYRAADPNVDSIPVPAPFSILGLTMALRSSRRLRQRIRSSRQGCIG